ncbi:MAG: aspartate-semialdehyde dehydrogenase [Nitrospira sp.]|nr:aspartate-semialdehyde dehydrogenase [Candidatus Manganitrophaceae bacterium]HIL34887.1 aspartate-semialdehyde dehydrogenase [Candidatus Manganitrophaceae bacterium]
MKKKDSYHVAIMGATGVVGQEILEILEERKFPIEEIHLFASERSAGSTISYGGREIVVRVLKEDVFDGIDLVLGATDSDLSRKFTPHAVAAGCVVIDNSSAFRMEPKVPLVVPEVNGDVIFTHRGIIANPNCSTAQLVVPLKPLHDAAKIRRVVVTTFQSVSGSGKEAMSELMEQTKAVLSFKEVECHVYPQQIAFNCIVNWDCDPETGYTEEETKIIEETKKIMGEPSLQVTATTIRVPVFRSHGESVNIETERELDPNEARALLSAAPGITVFDDPSRKIYPTPLDTVGQDNVYVGRIRKDRSVTNGLHLWVVADNLRKGAALNAVQIAEKLIRD